MQTFLKLFFLLTPNEKKKAGALLFLIFTSALMDMLGVASILPFMAVITNPILIEDNLMLNNLFHLLNKFGVDTNKEFILVLGFMFFILLVFSLFIKSLTIFLETRFVQMLEYSIGKRLVKTYLHQPYTWFLRNNSSNLGKTILSEVQAIINSGMTPLMNLISQFFVAISLLTLLIIVDLKIALLVGLSLSLSYLFIFIFVRTYLKKIGKERLINNKYRFISINEAFSAIKEIKIGGLENIYIQNFSSSSKVFARTQAISKVLNKLPRFLLETIAFGGILLVLLYVISKKGGLNSAIPILSLYVFAGYRLLPAFQSMYASFTQLTFIGPSIDKLHKDFKNLISSKDEFSLDTISLKKKIEIDGIYFNYPNSSKTILKNITLTINAKSCVAFVGPTGCGKTTLIDIILGLLNPNKGMIKVDGEPITKNNIGSWQRSIGYVPQNIYLTDDTVAANIAFGIKSEFIDQHHVEKVAKIANLHDFIINDLPKKYQTNIGERGIKLSGGQRQRIGIARALYHNPEILFLDEATSALDHKTENLVMSAINKLSKSITIILVTHRLDTVKNCDKIFLLHEGRLKKEGMFNELVDIL